MTTQLHEVISKLKGDKQALLEDYAMMDQAYGGLLSAAMDVVTYREGTAPYIAAERLIRERAEMYSDGGKFKPSDNQ